MQAPEIHDPNNVAAELPRPQDLHHTPHPILLDPRRDPRVEQRIGEYDLDNFSTRIPGTSAGMFAAATTPEDDESVKMNCCCGRSDCAYLEHNSAALGGLEKNLDTAARLGQVRVADPSCRRCFMCNSVTSAIQSAIDHTSY